MEKSTGVTPETAGKSGSAGEGGNQGSQANDKNQALPANFVQLEKKNYASRGRASRREYERDDGVGYDRRDRRDRDEYDEGRQTYYIDEEGRNWESDRDYDNYPDQERRMRRRDMRAREPESALERDREEYEERERYNRWDEDRLEDREDRDRYDHYEHERRPHHREHEHHQHHLHDRPGSSFVEREEVERPVYDEGYRHGLNDRRMLRKSYDGRPEYPEAEDRENRERERPSLKLIQKHEHGQHQHGHSDDKRNSHHRGEKFLVREKRHNIKRDVHGSDPDSYKDRESDSFSKETKETAPASARIKGSEDWRDPQARPPSNGGKRG